MFRGSMAGKATRGNMIVNGELIPFAPAFMVLPMQDFIALRKETRFSNCSAINIRTYLKKKLYAAGVSKIEIERASDRVKVIIYTAKPGVVIGKGGIPLRVPVFDNTDS